VESGFKSGIPATSMERLWSLAGAISGNRWQTRQRRKPQDQAKSVAVGCDRLPRKRRGKEGVDGSSPLEGFAKGLQVRRLRCLPGRVGAAEGMLREHLTPSALGRRSRPANRRDIERDALRPEPSDARVTHDQRLVAAALASSCQIHHSYGGVCG
jgi:hypothetical protein